jgi:hypothetical protein
LETAKLSIDEKLAQANAEFDKRLAAADTGVPVERATPKPPRIIVKPKFKGKKVGDVAHQHFSENETEVIERDCLYVEHLVNDRKGFKINETRYQGRVIVPQCVANYLSMMENRSKLAERGIFENRGRRIDYGEITG